MFLRKTDAAPALVARTFYRRSLQTFSRIYSRDAAEPGPRRTGMSSPTAIIIASVVAGLILLTLFTIWLRSLRARHPEPKYIPTPFLKRIWTNWTPSSARYIRPNGDGNGRWGDSGGRGGGRNGQGSSEATLTTEPMQSSSSAAMTIDRHTSVRSVMTLPAYRTQITEGEQVLGVEGERDGIDVVVELPTAEEEEALRDEEMEGLFQIREARRRQAAERELRNQRREQARAENDVAAMRAIRDEARIARVNNAEEIEALRGAQDLAKQNRQRAVSSVSYAEIGLVRHDGTRARASSNDSERMGLLSDAASIAALSIAASTRPSTSLSDRSTIHAGSSPELIDSAEADLGGGYLSQRPPPGYDEVSLNDDPAGSFHNVSLPGSGRTTPNTPHFFNEPPPDYPGPSPERRLSQRAAGQLAPQARTRISSSTSPQLPSLNFQTLPQIVIEPSTARPGDHNEQSRTDRFR
ncbi:hypothetical protein MAPG_06820 [Magnaporthiopsis poae ATCC 64411]|uniref:Uncharacterized protein n=1 Tax=Magnaporthiopsis poae (strain ATCC 64411 / 73-15) TaxID=644358 RepID=A0A0C4E328_MAGP6|nr:hypothetical protein MAPG_06820 [Magnaporthiopsis poae ATCC 64411]